MAMKPKLAASVQRLAGYRRRLEQAEQVYANAKARAREAKGAKVPQAERAARDSATYVKIARLLVSTEEKIVALLAGIEGSDEPC